MHKSRGWNTSKGDYFTWEVSWKTHVFRLASMGVMAKGRKERMIQLNFTSKSQDKLYTGNDESIRAAKSVVSLNILLLLYS